eukprot:scaffold272849_cov26-Tisochrysis_lutea.AAC.2
MRGAGVWEATLPSVCGTKLDAEGKASVVGGADGGGGGSWGGGGTGSGTKSGEVGNDGERSSLPFE